MFETWALFKRLSRPLTKTRCGNCGRINHQTGNCPDIQRKTDGRRPVVNKVDDTNGNQSEIVKLIVVNGVTTNAFVDPGSNRTLIRESFARELGTVEHCSVVLKGFAGGKFESTGKLMLNMNIDNAVYNVGVLIVKDDLICENLLLGRDVLCQEGSRLIIEGDDCRIEEVTTISSIDHITDKEQEQLHEILYEYQNCFAANSEQLGKCNVFSMSIQLTSNILVNAKPYRLSFSRRPIVDEQVRDRSPTIPGTYWVFPKVCGKLFHHFRTLTTLLRKDTKFVWDESQKLAFGTLIQILGSSPVLVLYDFNALHEVHTDASSVGIAGMLLQSSDGKNWKPVFFFSRHCTPTESKYHSYEL